MESYQKIRLAHDQLDTLQLPLQDPVILTVDWNGVKYEFLIRINPNSSHLVVMGSGAMNFNEKRIDPPYFQRHSWIKDMDDSLIFYNDPTLYLNNKLLVGWGQGTKDRFYLIEIAAILKLIMAKAKIPQKNVIFYGSSAGGFMSLILAGYVRESIALVNSPQTSLTKWIKTPVRQVFECSYPDQTEEDIAKEFQERIDVITFYHLINYVPKIYYLQNSFCEIDMLGHLIPFINGIQKINPMSLVNQVKVDLYFLPKHGVRKDLAGHGAVGKAETLYYINKVKTEFL